MSRDDEQTLAKAVDAAIPTVPDWPKKGILFRDIMPLFKQPALFTQVIDWMADAALSLGKVDAIIAPDARGFLFGTALAMRLQVALIPARKPGKLPPPTIAESYELEYGSATLEIPANSCDAGSRVLVVDDLLATGGTVQALTKLVHGRGATVVGYTFLIELQGLNGASLLQSNGPVRSLLKY